MRLQTRGSSSRGALGQAWLSRSKLNLRSTEQAVTTTEGTLVIEAAKAQGVEVPSFCYYPGLAPQGACRMCLVEVEKMPKLQTACTLVASDGMAVQDRHRAGPRRAQEHDRVPAFESPAGLPGVRQGRRVRIAGHDVPLRPRPQPLRRRKAALSRRKVVAAGLLRCSALHHVLPLRAHLR